MTWCAKLLRLTKVHVGVFVVKAIGHAVLGGHPDGHAANRRHYCPGFHHPATWAFRRAYGRDLLASIIQVMDVAVKAVGYGSTTQATS